MSLKTKKDRCGNCTLCCFLLPVPELNKPLNQECVHCAVNKGCKIWKTRPQVCRSFQCAYYQMDKVSQDLRPDNCKIVFEKVNDNIFFGTQDYRFDMTDVAKQQIKQFGKQGYSVIVNTNGKNVIYLKEGDNAKDIKAEFIKFIKDKYGRTII